MNKYIDAEKLIAKIRPSYEEAKNKARYAGQTGTSSDCAKWDKAISIYKSVLHIITSLQQEQPELDLVAELKHHLAITPKEQLEKEWKELEPWGNIGPTVQEFLYGKQPEVDLDAEIDKFLYGTKFKRDYDGVHVPGVCMRDWKGKKYVNRDVTPNDMRNFARHFYDLRNRALEEAARHVYESWMGGTMDDVRRDMVELGKVINARKEE